jgi:hypothetical protein
VSNFLYIVSCVDYTKIGITDNVTRRVSSLQTSNPYAVRLEASFKFDNAAVVERTLHERYSQFRVNREWFKLSTSQIAEIASLCKEWQKNGEPSLAEKVKRLFRSVKPAGRNFKETRGIQGTVLDTKLNNRAARRVAGFLKGIGYMEMTVEKCLYLSPVELVNQLRPGDPTLLREIARAAKLQP